MTLYTKCIYAPFEKKDGHRICVMSRLTKNDGITPVKELVEGKLFHYWAKILAPPDWLVGSYYRNEISLNDFACECKIYLSKDIPQKELRLLSRLALKQNITVLCVEEGPTFCHRKALAEECKKLESGLEIIIR